jgi:hypothetical protein
MTALESELLLAEVLVVVLVLAVLVLVLAVRGFDPNSNWFCTSRACDATW